MTFTLVAILLSAAAAPSQDLDARRKQLGDLLSEQWEYRLRDNPVFASFLGDKRYNDRLGDYSEKHIYEDLEVTRKFLARFEAIDTSGFPDQEALNKTLMVRELKQDLEEARFKNWEMPVSQFGGIHIDAPQLVTILSFETVKDYEDYIARLRQMPRVFDETTALMKHGLADKLMPPRNLLEQVAKQVEKLAAVKPEESPFMQPAGKFPASFSEKDKARLREAMLAAVRDGVTPAYAKFARFVAQDYAPHGRAEPGLWALPDGDARYAFAVKQATTTDLTPAQIHALGLAEVERDHAAMLQIAHKLGFADLKSMDAAIKKNPALHPKTRQEMIDLYRKYIDAMWARLPQLFGRLPKAKVEVMPVEAYREKEASGAQYETGTPDGKRPGHIKVNTSDLEHRTTLDVETTAYHEGVPGHHLQLSIAQELPALPPFRQHGFYIGYIEGWALYSERLAEELGAYQDPYSMYGHLQDDLLRAIRLVADTGYHSLHWSRQQVVDYFHANSGIDEPNVQSETDRYAAWPAQALGYKIGQLKLLELRERAKKELGAKFDLRAFHDEVLSGGAMPLDVLDARLAAWAAAQKASRL